jgi:hypothetical protein
MATPPSRVRTVSPNLSVWDIYLVRQTPAKFIGLVEATDAEAAIAEAVWRFDVKEPSKLMAVRRR